MKPLVALSAQTEIDGESYAVRRRYVTYLEAAGALCAVVAPQSDADALREMLGRFDGLFIPGGPDIDPALYGEAPGPGPYERSRDEAEIALVRCAFETGMPVFAICRGMQAMNVAFGGTIHDDIRAHGGEAHWLEDDNEDPIHPAHEIEVLANTPLAAIVGKGPIAVNSMHHQAIDRVGTGLVAAAFGPEATLPERGKTPIIEALFHPERPFFLGVQWHPEYGLSDEPSMALARAFVAACSNYENTEKARR